MTDPTPTGDPKTPRVFTFDVAFVLQVLAENEEEAEALCNSQGGYVISRQQVLRKEVLDGDFADCQRLT